MIGKKLPMIALLLCACLLAVGCQYIVIPDDIEFPDEDGKTASGAWRGFVTEVSTTDAGDLQIWLSILNETGEWSTMQALANTPAVLSAADGSTTPCDTVFIGTGGHRFPPGFQMRGYTIKVEGKARTQLLYVECKSATPRRGATPKKGATAAQGAKLSIPYVSYAGLLDYYDVEANRTTGTLELNLDEVSTGLSYPAASPPEGLIQSAETSITGLSDNVVTLLDIQRTASGLQFTWQNFNPTKFALKTHIGIPPVIGADGILYGVYEILDMPSVPITPAKENITWTTEVEVPEESGGFYILLSVESNKPRTYLNYVLDITSK